MAVVVMVDGVERTNTFVNNASYEVSNPTVSQPSMSSNSTLQSLSSCIFERPHATTNIVDSYGLKQLK